MVELYVENLKKSITELEIDKELSKYVIHHLGRILQAFSTVLGLLLLPLSGCESYYGFSQEYGMGKNKPYRILKRGSPSTSENNAVSAVTAWVPTENPLS